LILEILFLTEAGISVSDFGDVSLLIPWILFPWSADICSWFWVAQRFQRCESAPDSHSGLRPL